MCQQVHILRDLVSCTHVAPALPSCTPSYQLALTAGATSVEQDKTAAFPMAAAPGQPIKLPGQTRVTSDEYREFLALGHGEIFDLEVDRCNDGKAAGVLTVQVPRGVIRLER